MKDKDEVAAPSTSERRAGRRRRRPIHCPRCGELLVPDEPACVNCGRIVHDPEAGIERRIINGVLLLLVCGAAWIAGGSVVSFVHEHLGARR